MVLPLSIGRHLREMLMVQARPCLLRLSADYRLQGVAGDPVRYGLSTLHKGDDARTVLPVLHGIELHGDEHWPMLELADGVYTDVLLRPAAGGGAHLLLTDASHDHAERQMAQQHANEVQLLNRRLRRTLQDLEVVRAEITQKNHELDELNRLKTHFIAGLSHELRTPLTSILGHAELLHERLDGQDGGADESLNAIESGGAHLLSLINNVLDQASIEVGQLAMNPAPTDLDLLLTGVADMLRPMAQHRGLEFRFSPPSGLPAWVQTDVTRLRQVLINLTMNAIKYTDSGFVELQARCAGGRLQVSVSDTGPGIPKDQRQRILQPFQRGGDTGGRSGVGLGLAISVEIIRLLGGALVINERPGGGSIFSFDVPLPEIDAVPESAPAANALAAAADRAGLSGVPLLLVDDAVDLRLLYRHILEGLGYAVTEAPDVASAWERCASTAAAVLIVDLHLGQDDGATLIERLREGGYQGLIIGWSASAARGDRERMLAAGADAYLVKPVSAAVLRETLRELAETPGAESRRQRQPAES
ncbi:MAG: ATP-binding protein [Thiohalocapsa sp.]